MKSSDSFTFLLTVLALRCSGAIPEAATEACTPPSPAAAAVAAWPTGGTTDVPSSKSSSISSFTTPTNTIEQHGSFPNASRKRKKKKTNLKFALDLPPSVLRWRREGQKEGR
jgi:hypothetical protein